MNRFKFIQLSTGFSTEIVDKFLSIFQWIVGNEVGMIGFLAGASTLPQDLRICYDTEIPDLSIIADMKDVSTILLKEYTHMAKLKPFDKIHRARICQGLSITQKCILIVIASHLGKNEYAPLSLSTLMLECSITKRNSLVDNLDFLVQKKIVWKLLPSQGFKSCRYGIDFDLLVTVGYQTSNLGLPDQYPTVTSAVTVGYPKRKLNSFKRNLKEKLVNKNNGKSKTKSTTEALNDIRRVCGLRRH